MPFMPFSVHALYGCRQVLDGITAVAVVRATMALKMVRSMVSGLEKKRNEKSYVSQYV